MGWKYEVAIWTKKNYANGDWHYQTIHTGNNIFGVLRAYWQNRKNGCVKFEVRR